MGASKAEPRRSLTRRLSRAISALRSRREAGDEGVRPEVAEAMVGQVVELHRPLSPHGGEAQTASHVARGDTLRRRLEHPGVTSGGGKEGHQRMAPRVRRRGPSPRHHAS